MSFGLMNAAQTFQQLMDHLYCHLPLVFTYFDDHLIANRTTEEHLEHFKSFFSVLHENRLTINTAKFTFAVGSVKFLGHMVRKSSLDLLQEHIAAIQNFALHTLLNPHHDSALTFATGPHVDLSAIAAAQWSCPDIAIMQASPSVSVIYGMVGDVGLLGDISTECFARLCQRHFATSFVQPCTATNTQVSAWLNASYCWPKMGVFLF